MYRRTRFQFSSSFLRLLAKIHMTRYFCSCSKKSPEQQRQRICFSFVHRVVLCSLVQSIDSLMVLIEVDFKRRWTNWTDKSPDNSRVALFRTCPIVYWGERIVHEIPTGSVFQDPVTRRWTRSKGTGTFAVSARSRRGGRRDSFGFKKSFTFILAPIIELTRRQANDA